MPEKSTSFRLSAALRSWRLSLQARNLSVHTVAQYTDTLNAFIKYADDISVTDVSRRLVSDFVSSLVTTRSAATAYTRYKRLKQFFAWLVDEEELDVSPMLRLKPPVVPEKPVPVLKSAQLTALLKACADSRRDTAIVSLLLDTGIRRAECADLTLDDVDLEARCVRVLGKGRRVRVVPFGSKTARAIDRWLRVRESDTESLWLIGPQGVRLMLERRGEQAGVKLHAHLFRHTFAHNHLVNGGNEGDLMMLAGWKSRQMLNRYASSTAAERARSNYKSPLDNL